MIISWICRSGTKSESGRFLALRNKQTAGSIPKRWRAIDEQCAAQSKYVATTTTGRLSLSLGLVLVALGFSKPIDRGS